MNRFILCIAAAAAGLAAGWLLFSSRKPTQPPARFERTETALRPEEKPRPIPMEVKSSSNERPKPGKESGSPVDILEKLKTLRVASGDKRPVAIRQIIHQMESLVDLGPASVPVIRDFLTKFEDVDYGSEAARDDEAGGEGENGPGADRPALRSNIPGLRGMLPPSTRAARLDFTAPPSLRLGLIDVLKEIGSDGAEQVLAEVLSSSGRGVEVAYVARALHQIAGEKYRDTAVAAAKDLLANPPKIDHPNRFDENAKAYLYGVLDLYGDTSFAANAQSALVTADGHIDRTTLNYVTATLKEQAVPVLYQAYRDPRVTNISEKASIAAQILSHTGVSQQANDIFREMVNDENVPPWMRSLTIQSLAGSRGPLSTVMPTDPAQIQSRIELLNSLPELPDDQLTRARMQALERLSNRLTTVSQPGENLRTFRNRRPPPANAPAESTPAPIPVPNP